MDALQPGLTETASLIVTDDMLVPAFAPRGFPTWAGMPPVFATVMMVALMEEACVKLAHPRLAPGKTSVGAAVDIKHTAATPRGFRAIATATLKEVEGAKLVFDVRCADDTQEIGRGTHHRWIVDQAAFEQRVIAKASARS